MLRPVFQQFLRINKRGLIFRQNYHDSFDTEPAVTQSHMKSALKSNGLMFIEGHACFISDCPFCRGKKNTKDCKLFINKTTGSFLCGNCRYYGPWNSLERFVKFAKNDKKYSKELQMLIESLQVEKMFNKEWDELKNRSEVVSKLPPDTYNNLIEKFMLPNIPQEKMSSLQCLYEESSSLLHFPLTSISNSLISGYKSLTPELTPEYTTPTSQCGGFLLYRQKGSRSDDSIILVPSVRDFLALVESSAAPLVGCLPHNLQNLPQHALPCLEPYKKLILWFGNDEASWDTARQFAKKLSEQRCHFVRPTDLQPRPAVAAKLGYDLKEIAQRAQPIWHKSITTFKSLRQDVLSDLQNIDRVQGVKWKRYPTLNRILKGHRRGEFTVLTGPTGSGKTTFMSEYSLDLAMQGVNTLWGSFEIRNARLAKTMLQQYAGMRLDDNLDKFESFANDFEKLPIYFMTFHGPQSIKVVMEAVEHATYVHDIAHVIIDNVQFMMGMSDEPKVMDRFWLQDKIIANFRTFATKHNCHVTLVIHPRKEREDEDLTTASIFGGAKASQEADNILIIQDKRLTSVRGKKYLQVAKNRYSGDLGIMTLEFEKDSLSYASKKKQKTEDKQKSDLEKIAEEN